jgi:Tol biopolymer transport system component/DNA-binding winged helix-turn-helix (wHTH) protein
VASVESIDETLLRFEGFTIDLQRHGLYRGVERIHLTPIPFHVLTFLVQKRGLVASKHELLDAIWGERRGENTVEQTIRQIRLALGDEKEPHRFIRTVPGVGYSFVAKMEGDNVAEPERISALGTRETSPHSPRWRFRLPWITGLVIIVPAIAVASFLLGTFTLRQTTPGLAVANPVKITRSQAHILSPLLGDGARIYYPRYENGKYSVAAASAGGGESAVVVTGITNPELCDLAPDGETMLLRDLVHSRDEAEPLYVQPGTGPAQRVGDILAYDAAWYPDAKRIIYSADGVVYVTDMGGNSRKQLFSVPGNPFWFRWSPDGKRLRFTVIDKTNESTSIWEVAADGKEPHRLFPDLRYHVCCGSWTPDGEYFLFQARVGSAFQIWAQRDQRSHLLSARSQPFQLISGAMNYRGPLASKNGKKLYVRAEAPKGEIERYDSKADEFIPVLPSISARMLAYSQDTKWIAYTSLADNQLWRCRSDGAECLQLTQGFKNTVMPRWSPNGRTIAFMGLGFTGKWGVYSISGNGGTSRLLSSGDEAKGYPDWSPDGQRLVFSNVPPVSQAQGVYVLDLRSNTAVMLPASAGYSFPRWSPDGRFLVALHAGDLYLYLFDFSTGKWRPLGDVAAAYPNWSHNGRYVYFRPNTSGSAAVFRVAVPSGAIEKVASLAAVERGPFFMGDWIGLGPDDSPLTVRNSTIEDIYAWDLSLK